MPVLAANGSDQVQHQLVGIPTTVLTTAKAAAANNCEGGVRITSSHNQVGQPALPTSTDVFHQRPPINANGTLVGIRSPEHHAVARAPAALHGLDPGLVHGESPRTHAWT